MNVAIRQAYNPRLYAFQCFVSCYCPVASDMPCFALLYHSRCYLIVDCLRGGIFVACWGTLLLASAGAARIFERRHRYHRGCCPLQNPDAFTFVRIRYDSTGGYNESWYRYEGRDWQRWETDYPRAEKNLIFRLNELTSMKISPDPIVLRLTDDTAS